MPDLIPSPEEAVELLRDCNAAWADDPEYAIISARASGKLRTIAEWHKTLKQIGWFDPGSKRFCYTDVKEHDERKASYTQSVFVETHD